MNFYMWTNVTSLVLGLLSWVFPLADMVCLLLLGNKGGSKRRLAFSLFSGAACAISLLLQLLAVEYLVSVEDWSALMDTFGAVAFAAKVLVFVTILLHLVSWVLFRTKTGKAAGVQQ